jgi:DNA-binding transcriptional LysR family regulator
MKRSELPSLDDLRAFECFARHGSVRAAAQELALTHGAVSRRLSKLAQDLKVRLVEPDGRGLRLTPDGAKLAQAASEAFRLIGRSLVEIRKAERQPILLSCERSVAMRWLIPRLSGFYDAHPDIELHLSVGGGPLDFRRERVTLAIRRLDFPLDPAWTVTTLMAEEVGPVMQPGMADRFLAGDYVALGAATRPDAWEDWLSRNAGAPRPKAMRMLDHHFLMVESAASGLGVAMCPRVLALDDLVRGRLIAPAGFAPDGTRYAMIEANGPADDGQVAALKDWLFAIAAADSSGTDRCEAS